MMHEDSSANTAGHAAFDPVELIEAKRDGRRHTEAELREVVGGFVAGRISDYQMAAWLMAAYLRGLDDEETMWLTDAMAHSGRVIDLSDVGGVTVDKHSTGGVADTVTLVLAPLVASCGVKVAKMSGRGLGHTGGTLDKLESIPGFRVDLSPDEFRTQVRDIGIAIIAQSPEIDPADKLMYALRDVTGTVPSIPLITGSIVSKKIAGGAEVILIDVKTGSGAFMKTQAQARELARSIKRTGEALGKKMSCVITDMDQPLGMTIGNAIEVREAIETLRGEGPKVLTDVCIALGGKLLHLAGVEDSEEAGRRRCAHAIADDKALDCFRAWVEAQGGDARVVDNIELLTVGEVERTVQAGGAGYIASLDAEAIGRAAVALGAGRHTKDAPIDHAAGITMHLRVGAPIAPGVAFATLHASDESVLDEAESRMLAAIRYSETPPASAPLLLDA